MHHTKKYNERFADLVENIIKQLKKIFLDQLKEMKKRKDEKFKTLILLRQLMKEFLNLIFMPTPAGEY